MTDQERIKELEADLKLAREATASWSHAYQESSAQNPVNDLVNFREERDNAVKCLHENFKGVVAIRCTKHFRVPPYNRNECMGGECPVCEVQRIEAQMAGFKAVLDGILDITHEFPNTNENVTVGVRRLKAERDNARKACNNAIILARMVAMAKGECADFVKEDDKLRIIQAAIQTGDYLTLSNATLLQDEINQSRTTIAALESRLEEAQALLKCVRNPIVYKFPVRINGNQAEWFKRRDTFLASPALKTERGKNES